MSWSPASERSKCCAHTRWKAAAWLVRGRVRVGVKVRVGVRVRVRVRASLGLGPP